VLVEGLLDSIPLPSPPAEQAAAREDQAGQASASEGPGTKAKFGAPTRPVLLVLPQPAPPQ
jgi:hypothetical protein